MGEVVEFKRRPVILHPEEWKRAEAAGIDMSGYIKSEPLPVTVERAQWPNGIDDLGPF